MKLYISLPITGHEDTYEQRLQDAIEQVQFHFKNISKDLEIITPKDIETKVRATIENPAYEDFLKEDIKFIINEADWIFLHYDWTDSLGCKIEYLIAKHYCKNIFHSYDDTDRIKEKFL